MEQVFIDKIKSMIVESKTITQIVKTLFNLGCPDSVSEILDIHGDLEQEYIESGIDKMSEHESK